MYSVCIKRSQGSEVVGGGGVTRFINDVKVLHAAKFSSQWKDVKQQLPVETQRSRGAHAQQRKTSLGIKRRMRRVTGTDRWSLKARNSF